MRTAPIHAALGAVGLALAACSGSPLPRLYVLPPLAGVEAVTAAGEIGVGVGPVTVAPHLDRSQLVTRRGSEIHLDELDRWAEPLADGISRVLAENLGSLLATERTWIHPWRPSVTVDFQVVVEVLRCDRDGVGDAVIVARWTLLGPEGVLSTHRFEHREPAPAPAPAAGVEALGRGFAALSREISRRISEHSGAAADGRLEGGR